MKFTKLFPFLTMILFASLIVTSCSKEDSVVTTTEEEEIETGATYQINNRSVTFDAYASYCMDNGRELITISNNQAVLSSVPFSMADLEVNDYAIQIVNDPDGLGTFSLSGAVFGDDLGLPMQQNLLNATANVDITSNDGTTIVGKTDDIFLGFDQNGEIFGFQYTLDFVAEVVETSNFCD